MIVGQRELPGGVQEIVEIDRDRGVVGVLAGTWEEPGKKPKDPPTVWTPQAPKTLPDGTLMAYRCRPKDQFNINSDRVEVVIFDGPGGAPRVLPRPSTKAIFGKQNAISWLQHGHAAPTDRGTLIHAAVELETWWFLGWPVRKQWCVVETDLTGSPTGYRVADRAEPSWTDRGLTTIDPSGTGRIITPTRVFDKATASIGSKSFGWFDPHLSPDGSKVVWLDVVTWAPVTSGLILGDLATGKIRYLVSPTTAMQTDAMWDNDAELIGSRFKDGCWRVGIISVADGSFATIPNTENCTAIHNRRTSHVAA